MWTDTLPSSFEKSQGIPVTTGSVRQETKSPTQEEWEIVQRAQQYDETALASLYETYHPKIYSYGFLQMGDMSAAEDLASDVMLKMIESIRGYQYKGLPFGAWVFRIARNRIIDLHRRNRRRGEVHLNETLTSTLADPQTLAERALDHGQLQLALKHLTEEQRQVIVLKFIQGFDNRSIGRILGRREGAIKSLQHRALIALRRVLVSEKP